MFDIVMKDVLSVFIGAKELAVAGASSHLDVTDRRALADGIGHCIELAALANSTHGDGFICRSENRCGSLQEDRSTMTIEPVSYAGGTGGQQDWCLPLPTAELPVNMDAEELFTNIFSVLETVWRVDEHER